MKEVIIEITIIVCIAFVIREVGSLFIHKWYSIKREEIKAKIKIEEEKSKQKYDQIRQELMEQFLKTVKTINLSALGKIKPTQE